MFLFWRFLYVQSVKYIWDILATVSLTKKDFSIAFEKTVKLLVSMFHASKLKVEVISFDFFDVFLYQSANSVPVHTATGFFNLQAKTILL